MKLLITFCLLLTYYAASADFLIAARTGNLRQSPAIGASIIEKVAPGDTLVLLRDDQVAGYYHARNLSSGREGWIYRTLVHRITGDLPAELTGPGAATAVVEVRILDVGAGLCSIIKLPGENYVIYDAGGDFNTNGNRTLAQIKEHIPEGSRVELMVLSHTDADHIVAAAQVIRDYDVKKLLWSGFERSMVSSEAPSVAYQRILSALADKPATLNVNLNEIDSTIRSGNKQNIGNTAFTFLCGFGKPLPEWGLTDKAEKLNAVSIVMKMEFAGNSVLFCGDAVGRHKDDPEDALIATEKFLVDSAADLLPSTIIIAPHHGARNGSAQAFVDMVQPKAVVFAAGHKYHHPDTRTANQYLRFVPQTVIFRTDRGDDEGGTEWTYGRKPGNHDTYGDDDVHIQLWNDHTYRIFYVIPD